MAKFEFISQTVNLTQQQLANELSPLIYDVVNNAKFKDQNLASASYVVLQLGEDHTFSVAFYDKEKKSMGAYECAYKEGKNKDKPFELSTVADKSMGGEPGLSLDINGKVMLTEGQFLFEFMTKEKIEERFGKPLGNLQSGFVQVNFDEVSVNGEAPVQQETQKIVLNITMDFSRSMTKPELMRQAAQLENLKEQIGENQNVIINYQRIGIVGEWSMQLNDNDMSSANFEARKGGSTGEAIDVDTGTFKDGGMYYVLDRKSGKGYYCQLREVNGENTFVEMAAQDKDNYEGSLPGGKPNKKLLMTENLSSIDELIKQANYDLESGIRGGTTGAQSFEEWLAWAREYRKQNPNAQIYVAFTTDAENFEIIAGHNPSSKYNEISREKWQEKIDEYAQALHELNITLKVIVTSDKTKGDESLERNYSKVSPAIEFFRSVVNEANGLYNDSRCTIIASPKSSIVENPWDKAMQDVNLSSASYTLNKAASYTPVAYDKVNIIKPTTDKRITEEGNVITLQTDNGDKIKQNPVYLYNGNVTGQTEESAILDMDVRCDDSGSTAGVLGVIEKAGKKMQGYMTDAGKSITVSNLMPSISILDTKQADLSDIDNYPGTLALIQHFGMHDMSMLLIGDGGDWGLKDKNGYYPQDYFNHSVSVPMPIYTVNGKEHQLQMKVIEGRQTRDKGRYSKIGYYSDKGELLATQIYENYTAHDLMYEKKFSGKVEVDVNNFVTFDLNATDNKGNNKFVAYCHTHNIRLNLIAVGDSTGGAKKLKDFIEKNDLGVVVTVKSADELTPEAVAGIMRKMQKSSAPKYLIQSGQETVTKTTPGFTGDKDVTVYKVE